MDTSLEYLECKTHQIMRKNFPLPQLKGKTIEQNESVSGFKYVDSIVLI